MKRQINQIRISCFNLEVAKLLVIVILVNRFILMWKLLLEEVHRFVDL